MKKFGNFQDIQLSQATIDVDSPDSDPSGSGSGTIQLTGRRVIITDRSQLIGKKQL